MAAHRFFLTAPLADATPVPLSPADVHHLRDVLRLDAGDEIVVVFAGDASVVRLLSVGTEVVAERVRDLDVHAIPPVTLAQGLGKADTMDTVVRQATEIGVSRIVPFISERTVVRLSADKAAERVARWRRVAAEAAKQSQRDDVPEVSALVAIGDLTRVLDGSVVVVCWEERDSGGIEEAIAAAAPADGVDVAVVVGPEGGLSAAEVAVLEAAGARVVSLGPTILRTETAGVIAAAIATHCRGGLGRRRD